jgi:hypothetical protein
MAKLKFFVIDTTQTSDGKTPTYIFDSIPELVKHLEGMCSRQFKRSRKFLMADAADMGHAEDDSLGRAFYEQMCQYFKIGYIKGNSTSMRNIFEADYTENRRAEVGD